MTIEDKTKELDNELDTWERPHFWDNFFYGLQTVDIVKYIRLVLGVKRDAVAGATELTEFIDNPKGLRKRIFEKLMLDHFFEAIKYWKQSVLKYNNWYHGSIDALCNKLKLNIPINGIENLNKYTKDLNLLIIFPHLHDIEGLMYLAMFGAYFYDLGADKKVKLMRSVLFDAINYIYPEIGVDFNDVTYSVKNIKKAVSTESRKNHNLETIDKANEHIDKNGALIISLRPRSPHKKIIAKKEFPFIDSKIAYHELQTSPIMFAKRAHLIIPTYTHFPEISKICYVNSDFKYPQAALDIFRLKGITDLIGKTCIMRIGKPIEARELFKGEFEDLINKYMEAKQNNRLFDDWEKEKLDRYKQKIATTLWNKCLELSSHNYGKKKDLIDLLPQ